MGTKKTSSSSEKKLEATIKKLTAELKRVDAKATRWQKKAKRHQAALATSQKRVTKLEKKLAEARRTASEPATRDELSSPTEVVAPETTDAAGQPTSTPDMSWTVVRLRAEARARGLAGLSSKPKAEILAALT